MTGFDLQSPEFEMRDTIDRLPLRLAKQQMREDSDGQQDPGWT